MKASGDLMLLAPDAETEAIAEAAAAAVLPSQAGNAGKVLSTDGAAVSWQAGGGGGSGPNAPSFTAVAEAVVDTLTESNAETISGATDVEVLTVRGDGDPALQVNGGDWLKDVAVINGDEVKVRLTSASSSLVENVATVHYRGGTSDFSVTTAEVTDPDATAFFTAAGITDATIKSAVVDLVTSLKSAGIWSLLDAIYPFVGGTASTHKWNLKDPRDLDAAFRLVFAGGWTHSSTGALPNGTTGYADTKYNTSTSFSSTNGFMAMYSRTAGALGANPYDIGNASAGDANATILICRYSSGNGYPCFGTNTYPHYASPDGSGLFTAVRNASGESIGYRNGSVVMAATADTATYENRSLYLGCLNRGGATSYFSAREFAFAAFGDTLDATQNSDLYTIVQAFQTALGRQV